jgi:hypothetical protein
MDKVQKPSNSECDTESSEPLRSKFIDVFEKGTALSSELKNKWSKETTKQ